MAYLIGQGPGLVSSKADFAPQSAGMHGLGQVATPFDVVGGFAFDKPDLGPPQHATIIALARHFMARAIRTVRREARRRLGQSRARR